MFGKMLDKIATLVKKNTDETKFYGAYLKSMTDSHGVLLVGISNQVYAIKQMMDEQAKQITELKELLKKTGA